MLKLDRVTKVKEFYLLLVHVFNFDFAEFSAAILEKGLFETYLMRLMRLNYRKFHQKFVKISHCPAFSLFFDEKESDHEGT